MSSDIFLHPGIRQAEPPVSDKKWRTCTVPTSQQRRTKRSVWLAVDRAIGCVDAVLTYPAMLPHNSQKKLKTEYCWLQRQENW